MAEIEAPRRKVGITPLKSRRLSRGQTIREVSEATSLPRQSIVEWELANRRPPPQAQRKLARHFLVLRLAAFFAAVRPFLRHSSKPKWSHSRSKESLTTFAPSFTNRSRVRVSIRQSFPTR